MLNDIHGNDGWCAGLVELSRAEMETMQGGAICHGVSVLAWARVDGESLEAQGLDVVVAATTTEVARPHAN